MAESGCPEGTTEKWRLVRRDRGGGGVEGVLQGELGETASKISAQNTTRAV